MLFVTPLSAVTTSAVVAVREEVRARTGLTGESATAYDEETTPSATLTLKGRSSRYFATYAPRLTLRDMTGSDTFQTFHQGQAGAMWTFPRAAWGVEASAAYGDQYFGGIAVATSPQNPIPALQTLPQAAVIRYFAYRATLSTTLVPAHAWTLRLTTGYLVAGGADDAAKKLLPVQQGPEASADLAYKVDARSRVLAHANFERYLFSNNASTTELLGTAGYRYSLSRETSIATLAGVALLQNAGENNAQALSTVTPAASSTLTYEPTSTATRAKTAYTAQVGVAPFIDRVAGTVDTQVEAGIGGTFVLSRRWSFLTSGSVGRSLGTTNARPITLFSGQADFDYAPSKWLALDAGARALYQNFETPPATQPITPEAQWALFLAATVSVGKSR